MSRVPKTSTVWKRLDATCLPYVTDGHRDAIIEQWLKNMERFVTERVLNYLEGQGRKVSRS